MPSSRAVLAALAAGSLAAVAALSSAAAFPPYYQAFVEAYPESTLPQHMELTAGSVCFTCHHPPIGTPGACYREDLKALLAQSFDIADAIAMLHNVDSDGDGVPNGVEILTPRTDEPGAIGYHPGLVGPTGTDPCSTTEPDLAITNTSETPCLADWNRNGAVNSNDISFFLTSWIDSISNGDLVADFNGDGQVNSNDISAFLSAWLYAVQEGC